MSGQSVRVVSGAEMARVLGVSRRKVGGWKAEGWLVAAPDGAQGFDLAASLAEVVKHEQVLVSQAKLAGLFGWQRSYVTKLKKADRLVMVAVDGKANEAVDLGASLERIRITEPRKPRPDVADRHAGERESDAPKAADAPDPVRDSLTDRKRRASTELEEAKAAQAQAEYRKMIGELVDIESVRLAGADMGAMLRSSLENMQDQISAEVAVETDPARVHALLGQHFEHLLREISRGLEKLAGGQS